MALLATCLFIQTLAQENRLPPAGSGLASRIVLPIFSTREIAFDAPVTSVTVVDPEFVTAEVRGATLVRFHALREGETIVIITGAGLRRTYLVEVRSRPAETAEQLANAASRRQRELLRPSGIYSVSYTPSFGNAPALLRQSFDYSRKLSPDRALRISAETFKFFGSGERGLTTVTSFGVDRLMLGYDSPGAKLELFDSDLSLSPLSFNGYALRGVHLTSTPDSVLRGLEVFAGQARPALTLFGGGRGYLGGAILPVARGASWLVRAGVTAVTPHRDFHGQKSGVVWHADGGYAPDQRTSAEAEVNLAGSALSWRARLDLQRGPFQISGESLRSDRRSPLVGLGAQAGGSKLDAVSAGWQPSARFSALVSYNRSANAFLAGSRQSRLNNSNLYASANYNLTHDSRLGLRFSKQSIETSTLGLAVPLRLDTRVVTLNYGARFAEHWSNDFEAGFITTKESSAGTPFASGLFVRDELRRSWDNWSASAYLNYTGNTPSLASLVARNPDVLPVPLRRAYDADPSHFLVVHRDLLPVLLAGITLPETHSFDVGLRLQGAFSRFTLAGEARYSAGEILAREQRSLLTTFSATVRLDTANSVQVSAARSFALQSAGGQSALTLTYVHRFGGTGGGFQFSRLLGLNRGSIQGRVFFDTNGDGNDNAGEPGLVGMTVQLNGDRSATTDENGHFRFASVSAGEYDVAVISTALGISLRASTPTEQHVAVSSRQTTRVNFSVTNYGSVAGRVFNDLLQRGRQKAGSLPGVAGVRISLHPVDSPGGHLSLTVDAGGAYQFRNLPPGKYTLEIDPTTLPADFSLPRQYSWLLTVAPLENLYQDIPLVAQRAVSGVVFIDKDGDGRFDPEKDQPVEGARVITSEIEVTTGKAGSYILRNIPAGKIEVRALALWGAESDAVTVELGEGPTRRRDLNLAVARPKRDID